MKKLLLPFVLLPLFFFGCSSIKKEKEVVTYTNPIINKYLADPCLIIENGYYYLFATGNAEDGRQIPVHRSKDLTNWEFVRGAVSRGDTTDWNYKHFWAPEIYKMNSKFYLYYTASPKYSPKNSGNHVGLAVADNVEGPYKDMGRVVQHASIDGHLFQDKDSSMYFFYTIEHLNKDSLTAGQIYMDRMISPTRLAGKPKQIISHHKWQEGPFLQFRDGKYILTYSCGGWTNHTYHVRYAVADSPEGPFTEQPEKVLQSNEMVKGPGHHAMLTDMQGRDWIVYHGWDTAYTARYPRMDRVYFEDGKVICNGPTYTQQTVE